MTKKSAEQKKKFDLWKIFGAVIIIVIIGGNAYSSFKPQIASFMAEWSLREYKDDIEKCAAQTEKESGDKKIIGSKYECAINLATTFYEDDPEKAIQLCMINNPFLDIQLGREYSATDKNDLYAQKDEQIARTSCKTSIEKRLKKEEPAVQTPEEKTAEEIISKTTSPISEVKKSSDTQAKKTSGLNGNINLDLPAGYTLAKKESVFSNTQIYEIKRTDGTLDSASWEIVIVPIETVQQLDAKCAPGDCMRDFLLYPKENIYLADLENIKKDQEPIVYILNNQKYYPFTMPVNGDSGYMRKYITYFNDVRVIFTAWAENKSAAEKHDNFLKQVKILNINN